MPKQHEIDEFQDLVEAFRNVAADNMAQGLVVEWLLCRQLKQYPKEIRGEIAESLKASGRNTTSFSQLRASDAMSEMLSDVAVRMFGALDGLVDRAMARAEASEPK